MLNVLQVTAVNQLPALIYPTPTYILGDIPETYQWSTNTLEQLDVGNQIMVVNGMEAVL
jgi:hypothetical protein